MKRNFWGVAVALLALVLGGTAMLAQAQGLDGPPPGGPHGWGGPGHMGMALHELDLTDAQKAQIKTLHESQAATIKPLMIQLETNRKTMLTLTSGGNFDAAKVQALASQNAQIEAQLSVIRESLMHQVYTTVLTSEQRTKADQMRADEITHITNHLQKMQSGTETAPPE